jgi:hypothetical protein
MDPLDQLIPAYDIRERHEILVSASAQSVYDACMRVDLGDLPLIRAIFWLRALMMGASKTGSSRSGGFVTEMRRIGWGILIEEPGRLLVAGANCQPWHGDVVFTPRTAADFREFSEPEQVKIAWTLEVEPVTPMRTRLSTETRAVATDGVARRKFRRYYPLVRTGIVLIRWLMLRAVKRTAERG